MKLFHMLRIFSIAVICFCTVTSFCVAKEGQTTESKAKKRYRALWLYANGQGKEAFVLLNESLENPNSNLMDDFFVWLPIYRQAFYSYTGTNHEAREWSGNAKKFLKFLETKQNKTELDYVKLATLKPIGEFPESAKGILEEMLKKYPDTTWKDWIEYQLEEERAVDIYRQALRTHTEQNLAMLIEKKRAEYSEKLLSKNPNTYMNALLLRNITRYKRFLLLNKLDSLIKESEQAATIADEAQKKNLEKTLLEIKEIRAMILEMMHNTDAKDKNIHLLSILNPNVFDDPANLVRKYFQTLIKSGCDQNIPEDIRKAVLEQRPIQENDSRSDATHEKTLPPPSEPEEKPEE